MHSSRLLRKVFETVRRILKPTGPINAEPANSQTPLLKLPAEIILAITDFLDLEFRVLLSLSCKYLRLLLTSYLDLSLCDINSRITFLRYLEIDHPDFLTCRVCGWMFRWRERRVVCYACARLSRHSMRAMFAAGRVEVCSHHNVYMDQNVLELIQRALRRGPQHGLPVGFLSTNHPVLSYPPTNDLRLKTQARLVRAQLMLFSCWDWTLHTSENLAEELQKFNRALCVHPWTITDRLWPTVASTVLNTKNGEGVEYQQCSFCATDYRVTWRHLPAGRLQMTLGVWRNFGYGTMDTQDVEQIFDVTCGLRQDSDALPQRDLEALFTTEEAAADFPLACNHN